MDPRNVFGAAVKDGIEIATKLNGLPGHEHALEEWFAKHPEYTDPGVRSLYNRGLEAHKRELDQLLRDAGVDAWVNSTGYGYEVKTYPTTRSPRRPR